MAQTKITIDVDGNLKKDFYEVCNGIGLTSADALVLFMKAVVREHRIPFEINEHNRALSGKEVFQQIRDAAIKSGFSEMSLEEINEEIRAYREGR